MLEQMTTDKERWAHVAFGDVVEKVSNSGIPDSEESRMYIGLEHMSTESYRIRTWGSDVDIVVSKTRIKKGDVLFARRNTHLRRCAVAPFDTFFSPDGYAFRTKSEKLSQEYLLYLVASTAFMDFAVSNSAGTHSKRVKWTDLEKFEFKLPPIQEQARLVEAMTAVVSAQDELHRAFTALQDVSAATIDERMRGAHFAMRTRHEKVGEYHQHWHLCSLGDLLEEAQYGLSEEAGSSGQYPMLRMMNLVDGRVVENDIKYIDLNENEFSRYRLNQGDVLFNRTNSYDLVGRTGVYYISGDHVFASYLVRLITDKDRLDPEYLCAFLNAPIGRRQVMSFATRGVSQTNVNASNLRRILLPLPPLDYQKETVGLMRANFAASQAIVSRMRALRKLISKIISEAVTS